MDPLLALEWQREHLEWLRTDMGKRYYESFVRHAARTRRMSEPQLDNMAIKVRQIVVASLLLGETFAVADDMMDLVEYAADSLPDDVLERWMLPAEQGFVLFPRTLTFKAWKESGRSDIHVRAISWYSANDLVHLFYFSDNSDLAYELPPGTDAHRLGHLSLAHADSIKYGIHIRQVPVVDMSNAPTEYLVEHDETIRLAMTITAFWHLSQQTIAANEPVQVPRHAEKRWKRLTGIDNHVTRIVRLRRRSAPAPDGESREWHHRWIVRGHWRQQPCGPGRTQTRPVWIAAYVKGPEDAPLLDSVKVHHLVR